MKSTFTLLFTVACAIVLAQTGSISGRVIDSQTLEPLPFANAFLNNTTIGASTDTKGEFILKNVPNGTFDIIYSFIGYQTFQSRVAVKEGEEVKVIIRLVPQQTQLADVEIKAGRDKEWEKQVKKFERIFFGNTPLAMECKIVNPYVIDFPENANSKFIAKASAPIEIDNKAMGYHITFYLKDFWSDGVQYSIIGNSKFEELVPANEEEATRWMKNRREAYLGSPRHLFISLLEGTSVQEGYRLYTDRSDASNARLSSFNQDLEKSKSVVVYRLDDIITQGSSPYEKKISFKKRIEVHYLNKRGTEEVYKDVGHAVSWLEAKSGFALVNSTGILINSRELVFSGDMGGARVSNLLPLNYEPQHAVQLRSTQQVLADRLYETVYFQTNKSFYYPGEIIWFKGYMNYKIRGMADSLSRVLYVDLIDANKKVIQSKIMKIDSGRVSGHILLPAELPYGNYGMVAYTNWMRNYGDKSYSAKVLPILNIYDKPVAATVKSVKSSPEVVLKLNKEKYHLRDQVKVSVLLTDETDKPIKANLSVSVTDANQVPSVSLSGDIRNDLVIPSELKVNSEPFKYKIEYGITFNGEFQSGQKKQEPTKITIVQGSFEDVRKETTAANGRFSVYNLFIQDSALLSFQALRGNTTFGKVVSLPREYPNYLFNASSYSFPVERKESVQRNLSLYDRPTDAILLSGVEVKSSRITDNVYGKAESVITNEEISKYGSIEQLLRAKAPGFRLSFDGGHWLFLTTRPQDPMSGTTETVIKVGPGETKQIITGFNGTFPEPLLTIDNKQVGVGAGQTVGDRLMSFIPSDIERIEVSSLSASYLGPDGKYGLVAVFLKKGVAPDKNQFQKMYVKGYDSFREFKGPNYSDETEDHNPGDFRSTLLWKDNLVIDSTGNGEFSFYTSDVSGQYRIIIEGLTEKGKPIHFEQLVNVEK